MPAPAPTRGPGAPPVVKGMGTSWVERGGGYWARRVAAGLVSLLMLVFAGILTGSLAVAIVRSVPVAWGVLVVAVLAVVVGYSFWRGWRALVREDTPVRPRGQRSRLAGGAAGVGTGLLALAGSALASALLVLSAPFCVGWAAAWFLACLRHDYPGEAQARASLRR